MHQCRPEMLHRELLAPISKCVTCNRIYKINIISSVDILITHYPHFLNRKSLL